MTKKNYFRDSNGLTPNMIIRVFFTNAGAQYSRCFDNLEEAEVFAVMVGGSVQIN